MGHGLKTLRPACISVEQRDYLCTVQNACLSTSDVDQLTAPNVRRWSSPNVQLSTTELSCLRRIVSAERPPKSPGPIFVTKIWGIQVPVNVDWGPILPGSGPAIQLCQIAMHYPSRTSVHGGDVAELAWIIGTKPRVIVTATIGSLLKYVLK